MKTIFQNILVVIFVMVLFIILLELLSRMLLFPKTNGVSIGILHSKFERENYFLDKNNLRNFNFISNPKYLFLGDSFTFGSGIKTNKTFFNILKSKYPDSYNISIRGTNTLDHISSLKKFTDSNNKFNLIYQYYFNDIDYLNKKIIGPQLKTSDNFVDRILKKTFMWIVDSSYFFDYLLTPIAIKILSSKFDESLIFDESLYEKHLDDLKKIFEFTNKKNGKVIFIIFQFWK